MGEAEQTPRDRDAKPSGPAIRAAGREDLPTLSAMIRELAEYERMLDEVVHDEGRLRDSLFGERAAAEAVLAELDGQPVGMAVYFHNYSTFLGRPGMYLEDVFVRPAARGQGIGKALLRHVAQVACQRGCRRLEWAVLNWNSPAIEFYQSLGARPLDQWTVYRLSDADLERLAD